ncbi:MAG: hypothetical protein II901_04805 [Paludibacteraceae bacterium]|nr:hypothetical protein [Paludibacteraceae bacterium]
MKRVAILLTTIALSVGIAYAEGVVTSQNFHEMYNNGSLVVTNSNKTGTTDFVTYTCSGGTAKFYSDLSLTLGEICIFMTGSGAKVTTTTINDLDSICIQYQPNAEYVDIKVSTSDDEGSTWVVRTVVQKDAGISTVKMPSVGNYMIKIEKPSSTPYYIQQINYVTAPPCNCLRVIVTE